MGKNQSASNLPNIIQYSNGSINFVSGSTLLMQISSSGAITTTGVISGSNALSSSYAVNADQLDGFDSSSFVFTSSYNPTSASFSTRVTNNESTGSTLTTASASFAVVSSSYSTASGSLSTRVTRIEGNYATTGSNIFTGAQTVCANITSTGTIIAQTLNVQQVTSSIVYSSGSNVFGCSLSNTQQFTGSVTMTGSLTVTTAGTSPEFQVVTSGTIKGNALTDVHQVTGSLLITGSLNTTGPSCFSTTICANSTNGISGVFRSNTFFGSIDLENTGGDVAGKWNVQSVSGAQIGGSGGSSFGIYSYGASTYRMFINSSGNVGINTINPGALLDVNKCASTNINVISTNLYQNQGNLIQFCQNTTGGNVVGYIGHAGDSSGDFTIFNGATKRVSISCQGVVTFTCQVCTPTISMTGCIINTTDGGIFLKHSVNDKNFWVWQEFSNGWGQFTANCNIELNGLGGLFAGSGLATFFTNCGGGGGITLSSLTGAGNVCGVIGLNHSNGNAYFAGNIGMGANLSTNWATRSVLQLGTFGTSLSGYNGGGGATQLMHNIIANGFTYTYMNTGGATSQYMDGDSIVWANAAVCSAGTALTLIERMRITCGGNVGIGTSTPEGRLHIQGCTSGYGANLVLLNFCNATGASTGIDFGVDASSAGCGNGNAQIKVCNIGAGLGGNAADMTFHTWNGAAFGERFRISCNGNIFVAGGTLTNSANYKAHTFCLFDATSIPGKTFTVSGNTQGCFSVTDFTGIPTSARAVLVYGWYHINGDGLAGQADHAVSWFGVQNNTSLQTWSSPTQPWPGETTTFRCCNFGTFVMEHDGDASATGMSNGMNYYGSWHQGIIGVDSGGCIKYNLAHGYSSGTHYNGLYAAGYWL